MGVDQIARVDDLHSSGVWVTPTFDELATVFEDGWPYVELRRWCGEDLIVLGALYGERLDGVRVRRTCLVDGVPFRDIKGMVQLKNNEGGVRRFVKAIPLHDCRLQFITDHGVPPDNVAIKEMARVVEVRDGRLREA